MLDSTVLLSWGPPRMGTTWLFNVLRAMAETSDDRLGVVADGVQPPADGWTGPIIIKSHRADGPGLIQRFDSDLALHGLVMMRDPEPTLASLIRTQSADRSELLSWLETDVASYQAALPCMRSAVVIREEWVKEQGTAIVSRVAEITGMTLSPEQCSEVAGRFDREKVREQVAQLEEQGDWSGNFTQYDKQTQWHAGHIGPGDQPPLELTTGEQARVTALRQSIDTLTHDYSLWESALATPPSTSLRAMDFVQARLVALGGTTSRQSGLKSVLVKLMGRAPRG